MRKISLADVSITSEQKENIHNVLDSGRLSQSSWVEAFAHEFSYYFGGWGVCVPTSSCTTALHVALAAAGVSKGDEVVVPALTFAAPVNAVVHSGATPVFVDSEIDIWNTSEEKILSAITSKTKAIIVVHLYGVPAKITQNLADICRDREIVLIEDCAECIGGYSDGKLVGTLGDMSVFSFFGNKVVTSGEGGAILVNNLRYEEPCLIFRDHGINKFIPRIKEMYYYHDVCGFNARMTELQAALLVPQIRNLSSSLACRGILAEKYERNLLESYCGPTVKGQRFRSSDSWWLYSVIVKKSLRVEFMSFMVSCGIENRPFFVPCNLFTYTPDVIMPCAEYWHSVGVNLPLHTNMSFTDVDYICDCINHFVKNN